MTTFYPSRGASLGKGILQLILGIGIVFLFRLNAQAQGVVRPSSFHPLPFSSNAPSAGGRNLIFDWEQPPPSGTEGSPGAASAFGSDPVVTTPPPDGGTPIPVTKTARVPVKFRVGPVKLRVGTGLEFEFRDNIRSTASNQESDLSVTPSVQMTGNWAVSSMNDLSITVSVGYSYHLFHPELGHGLDLRIDPGTNFSFKAKVRDFSFVFYDRPSLQQSPWDDATRPSGILYRDFENTAGMSAFWNLGDVGVQLGYSHTDSIPLDSGSDSGAQPNQGSTFNLQSLRRTADSLSAAVTLRISDTVSAGLDAAVSSIRYPSGGRNDGVTTHFGAFLDKQLSSYTAFRVAAGYQNMNFQSDGPTASGDSSGFYGSLAIRNRFNRFLFNTLSIGQEADVSYTADSAVTDYLRDELTLRLFNGVALSTFGSCQLVEQSGGAAQSFTLLSVGFSASRELTKNLSVALGYSFQSRQGGGDTGHESSSRDFGSAGDFFENRVTFNLNYAF